MALLHIDSFDHYATADAVLKNWTALGSWTVGTGGRRDTNALSTVTFNTTATLQPVGPAPSGATIVLGFSFKTTVVIANQFLQVFDGATQHITLSLNADGSLTVRRGTSGGTVLGSTAAGVIVGTVTNYLELKVVIDDTVGTVDLHCNGASVLSLSAQDTRNAGGAQWTKISFIGIGSSTQTIDDLYLCDGTGSVNNNFLGDMRVDAHFPTGNGTTSNSTPSTGTDRGATTDDTSPNADTDYNTIVTVNDRDTLALANLIPTGATVKGIQTMVNAKKTDAGTCSAAVLRRSGGTEYADTAVALTTGYTYLRTIDEVDPNTGIAWTETNFNALEPGYKRTA